MDNDYKHIAAVAGLIFLCCIAFIAGIGITSIGLLWIQKAMGL